MTIKSTMEIQGASRVAFSPRSAINLQSFPLLGRVLSFAKNCAMYGFPDYDRLFSDPSFFSTEVAKTSHLKEEAIDPLLRQGAGLKQCIKELGTNSVEEIRREKMVGRFGRGRFKALVILMDNIGSSLYEVRSKVANSIGSFVRFYGENNIPVELGEEKSNEFGFQKGTRVSLSAPLSEDTVSEMVADVHHAFRFVKDVSVKVNNQLVNEPGKYQSLRSEQEKQIKGTVDIAITREGFLVADDGGGMDRKDLVERILTVGNSSGKVSNGYNDAVQAPNLYYSTDIDSENPSKPKKGRVSILMCGIEMQGVEIEGVNIKRYSGYELGTGFKLDLSKEEVIIGQEEATRIAGIVVDILKMEGSRKWAILNSLMKAIDKLQFENGEKEILIRTISAEAKNVSAEENKGEILFVPNEEGFTALSTDRKKLYVDSRLINEFVIADASLTACPKESYRSDEGCTAFWGRFETSVVAVEVGKNIVVNEAYRENLLLLNLRFNFHDGYLEKRSERLRFFMPWEGEACATSAGLPAMETALGQERMGEVKQAEKTERSAFDTFLHGIEDAKDRIAARLYFDVSGYTEASRDKISVAIARRNALLQATGERVPLNKALFDCESFLFEHQNFQTYIFGKRILFSVTWGGREKDKLFKILHGKPVLLGEFERLEEVFVFGEDVVAFCSTGKQPDSPLALHVKKRSSQFVKSSLEFNHDVEIYCSKRKMFVLEGRYSHGSKTIFSVDARTYSEKKAIVSFDEIISKDFYDGSSLIVVKREGKIEIWEVDNLGNIVQIPTKKLTVQNYTLIYACRRNGKLYSLVKNKKNQHFLLIDGSIKRPLPVDLCNRVFFDDKGVCYFLGHENVSNEQKLFMVSEHQTATAIPLEIGSLSEFSVEKGLIIVSSGRGDIASIDGKSKKTEMITSYSHSSIESSRYFAFFSRNHDIERNLLVTFDDDINTIPLISRHEEEVIIFRNQASRVAHFRSLPIEGLSIPQKQLWLSSYEEQASYEKRRTEMLSRIAAGDIVESHNLILASYIPASAIELLGDETIARMEARLSTTGRDLFSFQELYLSFIEDLWLASDGNIAQDRFRQVVSRWDELVSSYAGDFEELQQLAQSFKEQNLIEYLHDEGAIPANQNIKESVEFFTDPNLKYSAEASALSSRLKSGELLWSTPASHSLAFYRWAGFAYQGWSENTKLMHEKLLAKYNAIPNKSPMQKAIEGDVVQDLKPDIYIREFVQNSHDAGATEVKISTYTREIKDDLYHFTAYADNGCGATDSDVREGLLNFGGSKKRKSTKAPSGRKEIGCDGIGFKSVYNDADIVVVRTTSGDGRVSEVKTFKRSKKGEPLDIVISEYCEKKTQKGVTGFEVHVGKRVGKKSETSANALRIALRNMMLGFRIKEYVGLMDPEVLRIDYNGETINEPVLAREEYAFSDGGAYSLLEVSSTSSATRVAQNRLIVNRKKKHLVDKYSPNSLKRYVENDVFQLGEDEDLTTPRNNPMRSEKKIASRFIYLAVRKALKNAFETGETIEGIVPDYLYSQHEDMCLTNLEKAITPEIRDDAGKLNSGNAHEVNFSKYLDDVDNLGLLMSLVEVEDEQGKRVSLQGVRNAVAALSKDEDSPDVLNSPLIGERYRERIRAAVIERKTLISGSDSSNRESVASLSEELKAYAKFVLELYNGIGVPVGVKFFRNTGETSEMRLADFTARTVDFREEAVSGQGARLQGALALRDSGLIPKAMQRWDGNFSREERDTLSQAYGTFYEVGEDAAHELKHQSYVRHGQIELNSHGATFRKDVIASIDSAIIRKYNPLSRPLN
ncbi:hypothetical protein A2310_02760 [candidate division WOR-1 bacterium RIFOXYB2_FULL_37_13]|uniref:Uncharacterized protein n=1 Tax=candidate division WOR-1 bacterium RIFOXYB2_FULL_37_13 TaxID=1802579 RepID=A0A1F4SSS3_UNCSA|nr:MAG: hypothetical protein A2310_02760 [candidate division WOR-1 bacterium RIFOXYB2_FULL_37_13]